MSVDLYEGWVRHRRYGSIANSFRYRLYMTLSGDGRYIAFVTTTGIAIERFTVGAAPAEAFEAVRKDLEAVYAGKLALEARLDRKIADRRIFPAIDIQRSGTRKEELLLSQEELNRVYLLRNFLGDMPETEAIEFLLERMKRTKNNKEFFATMAQG